MFFIKWFYDVCLVNTIDVSVFYSFYGNLDRSYELIAFR